MRTFKERLVAGLLAKGYMQDWRDKSKYDAYILAGTTGKRFVGPNGALRTGRNASESWSIGDPNRQTGVYKDLLMAGDKALGVPMVASKAVEGVKVAGGGGMTVAEALAILGVTSEQVASVVAPRGWAEVEA